MKTNECANPGVEPAKRAWEPMKVISMGKISEVVRVGAGKTSVVSGDPGEPKKNVNQG